MAERLRARIHTGFRPGTFLRTLTTRAATLAGSRLLPVMLMLSWTMVGCAVTGSGASVQSADVEALNGRFRRLAFEQLSYRLGSSRPLSPPAQQAIEAFIAAGARRLGADGATAESISSAEANLNRFVSQLSEQADVGESGDISPGTVAATRNRVCPLYPFC